MKPKLRPAVFLDRDGVLNAPCVVGGRPFPPASVDALRVLPGAREAVLRLRSAGFAIVVVTNQPDVARGTQTQEAVEAINAALAAQISIDAFKVCYHDDADECSCRKPKPGLLEQAAADMRLDLSRSFMIGDRWRDIEAGRRAGCRTILIDWRYGEPQAEQPDARVASLAEAADWILARAGTSDCRSSS
jgi:D-glycero-D-manno-heptose 1,7-bisphosphate phosphatase